MLSIDGLGAEPSYALVSQFGVIYGIVVACLMAASVGDKDFLFTTPLWFALQIPVVMIVVADENVYGIRNRNVGYTTSMIVKFLLLFACVLENIGFLIWASIEWSDRGDRTETFIPLTVALLAIMTFVGTLTLILMTRMQYRRRYESTQ